MRRCSSIDACLAGMLGRGGRGARRITAGGPSMRITNRQYTVRSRRKLVAWEAEGHTGICTCCSRKRPPTIGCRVTFASDAPARRPVRAPSHTPPLCRRRRVLAPPAWVRLSTVKLSGDQPRRRGDLGRRNLIFLFAVQRERRSRLGGGGGGRGRLQGENRTRVTRPTEPERTSALHGSVSAPSDGSRSVSILTVAQNLQGQRILEGGGGEGGGLE